MRVCVISAPSNLGLKPTGVEKAPNALKRLALVELLKADESDPIKTYPYSPKRDAHTHLLNGHSIRAFSHELANKVEQVLIARGVPFGVRRRL